MQTFLPYADFFQSAACLDRQRLGKQRVEVLQLLRALAGETSGWTNHPAARMWQGYAPALLSYGLAICDEWIRRGYQDTCRNKMLLSPGYVWNDGQAVMPPWLGDPDFHRSHQSNLLRKLPAWYSQFGWDVSDDLPYIWPVP